MNKQQERFKDDICKCSHDRKLHGKSQSINFTEGSCSNCNCQNFMMKDNSFTPQAPSHPCHYGEKCSCDKLKGDSCSNEDCKPHDWNKTLNGMSESIPEEPMEEIYIKGDCHKKLFSHRNGYCNCKSELEEKIEDEFITFWDSKAISLNLGRYSSDITQFWLNKIKQAEERVDKKWIKEIEEIKEDMATRYSKVEGKKADSFYLDTYSKLESLINQKNE